LNPNGHELVHLTAPGFEFVAAGTNDILYNKQQIYLILYNKQPARRACCVRGFSNVLISPPAGSAKQEVEAAFPLAHVPCR
jgi:hypothetical protein